MEYEGVKPIYLSVRKCNQEERCKLWAGVLNELEKSLEALEEGRKRAERDFERDRLGIRGQAIYK